jgi:hypothetical protein
MRTPGLTIAYRRSRQAAYEFTTLNEGLGLL